MQIPSKDYYKVIQEHKTTRFVVKNITFYPKIVSLYGYPVEPGLTRDLLSIPEISEADIRFGLLKGEILVKLLAKEIFVVESNIDLLQFNAAEKAFLKSVGVLIGTEIGEGQLTEELLDKINTTASGMPITFHQNMPLIGAKNGLNRFYTTPGFFINGMYLGSEYRIEITHNGRKLDPGVDYTVSESGGAGTGFNSITFLQFSPLAGSRLLCNYVSEV